MRRQRLRPAQAHSVCALCASRLARDASRLPPYGAGPIHIRENSRVTQLSNPDGTTLSESQSSSDTLRKPASSHASQASSPPSGTIPSSQPPAKDGLDDLDFMDEVRVERRPAVANQPTQSQRPQSLTHSVSQAVASTSSQSPGGGPRGGTTSDNNAQMEQGYGQLPVSSTANGPIDRRTPPYISRFNKNPRRMVAYNMAAEPPKNSRIWDPEETSSWSHLKRRGNSQNSWRGNTPRESQERVSEHIGVLNPLKTGTADHKSAAYASHDFASILERLGSKSSQKNPTRQATDLPKPAPAPPASRFSGIADMSFADYDFQVPTERSADQNAAQSTQASPPAKPSASEQPSLELDNSSVAPAEYQDTSADFDPASATPKSRSAPVTQQAPPAPEVENKSPVVEDPSAEFDFAAARPTTSRLVSVMQQAPPAPEAEDKTLVVEYPSVEFDFAGTKPESRSAPVTQQTSPAPEAEHTSLVLEDASVEFDFAAPAPEVEDEPPVVEAPSVEFDFAAAKPESKSPSVTQEAPAVPEIETKPSVVEDPLEEFNFAAVGPEPGSTMAAQQATTVPEAEAKLSQVEDPSEELDFAAASPKTRSTTPRQQSPTVPQAKSESPVVEEYKDLADDIGFIATVPSSNPSLTPRETPIPAAQPKLLDDSEFDFTAPQTASRPIGAKQQETRPEVNSAPRDNSTESFDLDVTQPVSTSRSQPTRQPHNESGGATLMTAKEFFKDDAPDFSKRVTSPKPKALPGEEMWAEVAARRTREQPQILEEPIFTPAPTPTPTPKRVQWSLPVEEPQRKSRSSRFIEDEKEVDDGRRKRKNNRSSRFSMAESDLEGSIKAEAKAERKAKKRQAYEAKRSEVDKPTPLYLPEYITVSNFANLLKVRSDALLKKMEEFGYEDVRPDDILNAENAGLIAAEYNYDPIPPLPEDMDLYPTAGPEDRSTLPLRPPVVTIMGHVDHGKTTLLDYLRKSSVAASEFGGITQHIGAFNVALSSGKTITFLDTPGHAAFLNMRQRGANVTDIVILVVAADDGVKAQTEEAIKHAQSAGVPIIVAINKIDREGADVQRVKQDLARHDLYVEDFGGDIQAIPVSGKTGQGMEDLEEATSLLSEILDHRADPTGPVEGHIIEASTKERGRVATLLIRRGTLKVGDIIVAGTTFARVRTIRNEGGVEVDSVGPGMPAEVDGWRGQPEAGDEFLEAPDEQRANEAIEYRTVTRERVKMAKDMEIIAEARRQEHDRREKEARRQEEIAKATKAGIENAVQYVDEMEKTAHGSAETKQEREEVPLVLKADVSGSEEACHDYIMTVGNNEVCPKIARSGVGPVTEFDVDFASTAKGYIVAFNVEIPQHIRRLAGYHGVKLIENNVIYRLVDDIKTVLEDRLPPLVTHKVTGEAKILKTFEIGVGGRKKLRIAGCRVENGLVKRTSKIKVLRHNEIVYQGTLSSLKNVKRDVSEMRKDTECGIGFDGWSDFRQGDSIQCYEEVQQKRYL